MEQNNPPQSIVTKKTIAVLLVITIFLSLVGTWVMLNAVSIYSDAQYARAQPLGQSEGNANVLVTINNPAFAESYDAPSVTGQVIVSINKP